MIAATLRWAGQLQQQITPLYRHQEIDLPYHIQDEGRDGPAQWVPAEVVQRPLPTLTVDHLDAFDVLQFIRDASSDVVLLRARTDTLAAVCHGAPKHRYLRQQLAVLQSCLKFELLHNIFH